MNKINFAAPAALIIIDAWRNTPIRLVHAISTLYQTHNMQCVIIASYPSGGEFALPAENPGFANSSNLFLSASGQLTQQWKEYIYNSNHGTETNPYYKGGYSFKEYNATHQPLLTGFPSSTTYSAWTVNQASYIINTVFPTVENIYLAGGAWNRCLKDRALGIDKLAPAIKCGKFNSVKHLLVDPQCVYDYDGGNLDISTVATREWKSQTYLDSNNNSRTVLLKNLKAIKVDCNSLQWQDFNNPYHLPDYLKQR